MDGITALLNTGKPMKKILFISYDGMTDPLGQSQVIPYLSGLTKFGYSFTILSCDKSEQYASGKEYVQSLLKDYPIDWVSIPYHKSPAVLSSVYDYYQLRKTASALHQKNNYVMVHTRPGVPTLVALWLKKKYNLHFLNDVRGFWADERVDGGMWNLKNPLYKTVYNFFKKHEYECLEKADFNTCLTQAAKKEMLTWKQVSNQPLSIDVIPCSADLDLFNPQKINAVQKEAWLQQAGIKKDDIVFTYLGSIGGWYLTSEMMRFAKRLADKMPNAKFLFISPHRHEQILAAAATENLSRESIVTVQAKRHEVPLFLSVSNYAFFFIKPCYSKLSSSPTKHGEIMAMGLPVITNAGVGDVKEIITQYNAGLVLENFSDAEMDRIIDLIQSGSHFDAAQIREAAKEIYSLEKAVLSYKKVYDRILNR